MFKLIKTKNNQRFYKLDEPIKYIEEDLYTAKKFWEEFHERITKIKINGFPNGYKPSSRTLYDEYNQETIPDFIEYIIISDGIDIKERVAFIGYKCEKTNEIRCTYQDVEKRIFDTYEDILRRPYNYIADLDDDDKILERIIEFDKPRKEWNNLTKDELIDKYKNSNDKYDFGKYVYEEMQKTIIVERIKNDVDILKHANDKILEDKEFMLELLKINFYAMKYISYYHFGCDCDN